MSEQTTETPKHPGGRPTKYSPDITNKVYQYIDAVLEKRKEKSTGAFPTKVLLAANLGIDDETIIEWRKIHPEFSAAIKKLEQFQQHFLMYDGLYSKETSPAMAIFLLKANHGMRETTNLDHTTNGKDIQGQVVGFNYLTPDKLNDPDNSNNKTDS